MTNAVPAEDEVSRLATRVSTARGRLAYQFDPALTEALSEDELNAERDLAERIRKQDREQRWKHAQAVAAASDRARRTTEQIEEADISDLLLARKAIAAQVRESSPYAKLASLCRHRAWSMRALAGVVVAGMLWSAVNVQQNIAPGGLDDPLYWFSYLLEGMISVCLIIIMIGTNKVADWGVVDSRRQVALAEIALLALTVTLNTYPYVRAQHWYEAAVHAVAPVMIGVALLIHDAASVRYGLAITRATEEVRHLPDPADQVRQTLIALNGNRLGTADMAGPLAHAPAPAAPPVSEPLAAEVIPVAEAETMPAATVTGLAEAEQAATPVALAPESINGHAEMDSTAVAAAVEAALHVELQNPSAATVPSAEPVAPEPVAEASPELAAQPSPERVAAAKPAAAAVAKPVQAQPNSAKPAATEKRVAPAAAKPRKVAPTAADLAAAQLEASEAKAGKALQTAYATDSLNTGQLRVAEILEQELAELQAARRGARAGKP